VTPRVPHEHEVDEVRTGDPVSRGAVEEIAQLLGYDPNRVAEIVLMPLRADVYTFARVTGGASPGLRTIKTRHVIL